MQKKHLFIALLLLMSSTGFSQRPYYNERPEFMKANSHWFFGAGNTHIDGGNMKEGACILDFNTNPPTPSLSRSINTSGLGLAAVSDTSNGKFLFCTTGNDCWNKNMQLMPNGVGLAGDTVIFNIVDPLGRRITNATNQSAVIVPVIGDPYRYYVFSLGSSYTLPRLYYSIVDMTLEGGLGDVDTNHKGVLLSDTAVTLGRSMMAVPGDNCDIWLVVHPEFDTVFYAYHITEAGIDPKPVISSPGGQAKGLDISFEAGVMAVSPDRSKLAISSYFLGCSIAQIFSSKGGVIIAEFDVATGEVSNGIMADDSSAAFTMSFSPDNSKLYVSNFVSSNPESISSQVCQYDLSNYTQAAIANSRTVVREHPPITYYTALRSRGDTILVSTHKNEVRPARLEYIASPNSAGSSCDYRTDGQYIADDIADTIFCGASFGTDVVYPLFNGIQQQLAMDTTVCADLTLEVPVFNTSYVWDDGSTDTTRIISSSGRYWVEYNDGCHYGVDTFVVNIERLHPVINVDGFKLSTTESYQAYQWLLNGKAIPGATQRDYHVTKNGDYQVVVNGEVCTDTSDVYEVTNVDLGISNHAVAEDIDIYPNPAKEILFIAAPFRVNVTVTGMDGRVIKVAEDVHNISLSTLAEGIYLLKIADENGILLKVEKFVKTY